jgi:DNA-binding CsgD family transcriptional regulator
MKQYAVYKGEECLAIGNIYQLANKLNIKEATIRFYLTPTYKKRVKKSKNRRELVEV